MARRRQQAPTAPDVADIISSIQDELPGVRMMRASESVNPFIVRRPTGISDLDIAIGGGIPAGGFTEFWGKDNSGKNLMINLVLRQLQRNYEENTRIAFIGIEHEFDKDFARKCGVVVPYSPQEIASLRAQGHDISDDLEAEMAASMGEIVFVQAEDAEHALELLCKLIATDAFQLICMDSVAQLLPADEEDAPLMENKMLGAKLPMLMAKFFRKSGAAFFQQPNDRPNLTSVILTNQITADIGGFSRPGMPAPVKQKAGHAMKHAKLLSLRMKKSKRIEASVRLSEAAEKATKKVIGHEIVWTVTKGKAGCADGATGNFDYIKVQSVEFPEFGPRFDKRALATCLQYGVIIKSGAVYTCPSILGDRRCRGKESLLTALSEEDAEWYFSIYNELMRAANVKSFTSWAAVN